MGRWRVWLDRCCFQRLVKSRASPPVSPGCSGLAGIFRRICTRLIFCVAAVVVVHHRQVMVLAINARRVSLLHMATMLSNCAEVTSRVPYWLMGAVKKIALVGPGLVMAMLQLLPRAMEFASFEKIGSRRLTSRTDWCGLFTPDRAVDHRHFLVGVVNRRGEENYFVHLRHGLFDSGYFVLFDLDGAPYVMRPCLCTCTWDCNCCKK